MFLGTFFENLILVLLAQKKELAKMSSNLFLNALVNMKNSHEKGQGEIGGARPEIQLIVQRLSHGGAINCRTVAHELPADLNEYERKALQEAVVQYVQSSILRGQIEDLRGVETLFSSIGIENVEFSPEYVNVLETFLEKIPMVEVVSFIMRGSPDKHGDADKLLKRFLPAEEVSDRTIEYFIEVNQLLVRLHERGIKKLSGRKLTSYPKLLSESSSI